MYFCMKKHKIGFLFLLIVFCIQANAQQYALFNTKTLFDSFENPAQKSFVLDSSRQYASNFLLPYLDLSSLNRGSSDEAIRNLINTGYHTHTASLNPPQIIRENINIYLLSFRMFKYRKYHSEMGFSWQIKSESETSYNEQISQGLFKTVDRYASIPLINVFNNHGKMQAYHQISFNYRENYRKNWALGAKVSLLSGIGYTEFQADRLTATINPTSAVMQLEMNGKYKLNYPEEGFSLSNSLPFKNLGAALSLGTTYTTRSGIFMMANLKDLGFIRWGKKSYAGTLQINEAIANIGGDEADKNLEEAMISLAKRNQPQAFISTINTKADFLISKTFGPYTPSLIISKNVFNPYGEAALINTLKSGIFSFSAVPGYTLDKNFKLGLQGMLQTPNFEMFLGTNDLIQSYYAGKDIANYQAGQATGYNRASVYLGMAFKIGYVVEHPQNMSWMPGVGKEKERKSLFGGIFNLFKKKQR